MFGEEDRDRIGFLARGAARDPDPDLVERALVEEQPRDDLCLERYERILIAEEVRDADQEVAQQLGQLLRMLAKVLVVAVERRAVSDLHAAADSPE